MSRARNLTPRCGIAISNRSGRETLEDTLSRAPEDESCVTMHCAEIAPSPKDMRACRNVLSRDERRVSDVGLLRDGESMGFNLKSNVPSTSENTLRGYRTSLD